MNVEVERRLRDALGAGDLARRFTAGLDLVAYREQPIVRSAVERQIEIVGEALNRAARLDPTLEVRIPELRRVVGMRNRLIHGYDEVDDELIWDVVHVRVPALQDRLRTILDLVPDDESAPNPER